MEQSKSPITWFETADGWMARQSIAIVGKIWPAADTKQGMFYWSAVGWATKDANGKTGSGYTWSLEDAKNSIKAVCGDNA